MKDPLISVVLPIYNGEKYLNIAIDSILSQTFTDFELILINDGSSDNSLSIAQAYKDKDARIVLLSQENIGLIATLNKGILLSVGQYIARMDQDDISLENRLYEQVKLLKNGNDICGCHYEEVDASGLIIAEKRVPLTNSDIALCLGRTVPFAHGSVMFKKDKFYKKKLKYGNTPYSNVEDYALWCEMYKKSFVFSNVDQVLFKYRNIDETMTSTKRHLADSARMSLVYILSDQQNIKNHLDSKCENVTNLRVIKNYIIFVLVFLGNGEVRLLTKIKYNVLMKSIRMFISVLIKSKF
jgi:glycosyltransferase involved in cell wall biosynthesis